MTTYTHTIDYKGYTVVCESGLYYLAINPGKKYFSFSAVKSIVDDLTKEADKQYNKISLTKNH